MFRLLVILLVFALSLSALTNQELLKRANGFMKSSNKSNQFRAYDDYKTLYLRAMMKEDDKLLLQSLHGIVKSGNKLHIDVSQYQRELTKSKPKTLVKKSKIKKNVPKNSLKTKVKVQRSNRIKNATWNNEKLVLQFEKALDSKKIHYVTKYDSKRKRYQYIFDIDSSALRASKTLRKKSIDRVKLTQHNSNVVRLLVENKRALKVRYKKEYSRLVVSISSVLKSVHKSPKVVTPKRLDRNKVIVIDAGHGGKDPGALGYKKYREKVVVLSVAKSLRNILKSRGYKVYMTRMNDKFVKLSHRTQYANKKNADIFISIHANAVGHKNANKVQGIETYFLSKSRSARAKRVAAKENQADLSDMDFYGKESFLNTLNSHNIVAANKLAIDLQRGALASLNKSYKNVVDAGVREGPFWVLVGAQMPSVLVEIGFISHPKEAKRLVNSNYQKKLALGLANGVERYFINN